MTHEGLMLHRVRHFEREQVILACNNHNGSVNGYCGRAKAEFLALQERPTIFVKTRGINDPVPGSLLQ